MPPEAFIACGQDNTERAGAQAKAIAAVYDCTDYKPNLSDMRVCFICESLRRPR
jgi:hypothetical protein